MIFSGKEAVFPLPYYIEKQRKSQELPKKKCGLDKRSLLCYNENENFVCKHIIRTVCNGRRLSCEVRKEKKLAPKITLNEDKDLVAKIKEGLAARGGYCPCRLPKTEDYKCMCKEFREQIADPDFEGYCHCMLYYKSKK